MVLITVDKQIWSRQTYYSSWKIRKKPLQNIYQKPLRASVVRAVLQSHSKRSSRYRSSRRCMTRRSEWLTSMFVRDTRHPCASNDTDNSRSLHDRQTYDRVHSASSSTSTGGHNRRRLGCWDWYLELGLPCEYLTCRFKAWLVSLYLMIRNRFSHLSRGYILSNRKPHPVYGQLMMPGSRRQSAYLVISRLSFYREGKRLQSFLMQMVISPNRAHWYHVSSFANSTQANFSEFRNSHRWALRCW